MKKTILSLLTLTLLCGAAMADCQTVDSLNCQLIDWLDAPSNHEFYHYGITESWPIEYCYSGTGNYDLAMGDSFMVWLPGSDRILFLDSYDSTQVDTTNEFDYGSVDAVGVTICDTIIYLMGGGGGKYNDIQERFFNTKGSSMDCWCLLPLRGA